MARTITARAPGKLFIAGEYAVVEPGNPAVLVAVNRYITVRVTPGQGRRGTAISRPRDYLTAAASAIENLRVDKALPAKRYRIRTSSELTRRGRKLGLGSSAAVTVAAIEALGELYGLGLTRVQRYRIALCATIQVSPKASGGDIAASTFGGWIRYTSPDRQRILTHLLRHGIGRTIANEDLWEGASITPVPAPVLPLLVGWTATPADTNTLVAAAHSQNGYPDFLADSRAVVEELLGARTPAALLRAVEHGRDVLDRLAHARGLTIETPALRALRQGAEKFGGAGKTSGAGGGDCGIAFAAAQAHEQILTEWRRRGIIPLDLAPHYEGDHQ